MWIRSTTFVSLLAALSPEAPETSTNAVAAVKKIPEISVKYYPANDFTCDGSNSKKLTITKTNTCYQFKGKAGSLHLLEHQKPKNSTLAVYWNKSCDPVHGYGTSDPTSAQVCYYQGSHNIQSIQIISPAV